MIPKTALMEQFSLAYVRAVAHAAGCGNVIVHSVDYESVDLSIHGTGNATSRFRNPVIDVQAKSTYQDVLKPDSIQFPLSIKNYDDLRDERVIHPRILVVVRMPKTPDEWTDQDESRLGLRFCAYWLSLRSQPAVANEKSITVSIPRKNIFSVSVLESMMTAAADGGFL